MYDDLFIFLHIVPLTDLGDDVVFLSMLIL